MTKLNSDLRTGDWVEVRSAKEIAQTLDSDGSLDGLPFMPEMLAHCGRRFRVLRLPQKTCIEVANGDFHIRELRTGDLVLLDGLRCSGDDHGGCQRACMLFWKKAWLRKVDADEIPGSPDTIGIEELRSNLKTMTGPDRYFCQSTEINKITRLEPMKPSRVLYQCWRDVRSGAVGIIEMIALILVPLCRKIRDKLLGRPRLLGSLTRTPVGTLGLQPGEIVEIKSLKEMQETLDRQGRNRGLVCDIELRKFCGKKDRVRNRLERMISECSGEMKKVEATVILEGNPCLCARVLGGCPRLDFTYWREVWLKRVESPPSPNIPHNVALDSPDPQQYDTLVAHKTQRQAHGPNATIDSGST